MSLNAVVFCDCIEKGQLTIPHPRPELLFIDETGSPDISSHDPAEIEAHDRWQSRRPCQHEHFWLIERWLGNTSLIGSIRALVHEHSNDPAREYPVLWSKVIHSGSHSGDFVKSDDVLQLQDEVDRLSRTRELRGTHGYPLAEFLSKLRELIRASLTVKKPISF
jgi:hypothetical protein